MHSKAPPMNIIHQRNDINHLNSNEYHFFVAWHLMSWAERVPQIWYFVCSLRVNLGWNYTVWPIIVAGRCFQKLCIPTLYIEGRLWTTSAAMNVSPCMKSSPFLSWEGNQNLTFCVQFESQPLQKSSSLAHKGLVHAIRKPPHLPSVSNKGY